MEPIYDSSGAVQAWLDADTIRGPHGNIVAFIHGDMVVSVGGGQLGWWWDGWLRDFDGHAIGFIRASAPGPQKPMLHLTPLRPLKGLRPLRPLMPMRPLPPEPSRSWGRLHLNEWIRLI